MTHLLSAHISRHEQKISHAIHVIYSKTWTSAIHVVRACNIFSGEQLTEYKFISMAEWLKTDKALFSLLILAVHETQQLCSRSERLTIRYVSVSWFMHGLWTQEEGHYDIDAKRKIDCLWSWTFQFKSLGFFVCAIEEFRASKPFLSTNLTMY